MALGADADTELQPLLQAWESIRADKALGATSPESAQWFILTAPPPSSDHREGSEDSNGVQVNSSTVSTTCRMEAEDPSLRHQASDKPEADPGTQVDAYDAVLQTLADKTLREQIQRVKDDTTEEDAMDGKVEIIELPEQERARRKIAYTELKKIARFFELQGWV